jgi:chorismate mutase
MTLEDLRADVDAIDAELVALLARRRAVVARMAALKRMDRMAPLDAGREAALAARWTELAEARGLPAEAARAVLDAVLVHSREHVRDLAGAGPDEPEV